MIQYLERPQGLATRLTRRLTVEHPGGLHARASGAIVKTVKQFQARVLIRYGDQQADASGIFDILMLGVPQGAAVVFEAEGPNAGPVLDAISKLFAADFGLSDG